MPAQLVSGHSAWTGPSQALPKDSHTEQYVSGAEGPASVLKSCSCAGYSSGPRELQYSGLSLPAPRVLCPGLMAVGLAHCCLP